MARGGQIICYQKNLITDYDFKHYFRMINNCEITAFFIGLFTTIQMILLKMTILFGIMVALNYYFNISFVINFIFAIMVLTWILCILIIRSLKNQLPKDSIIYDVICFLFFTIISIILLMIKIIIT